MHTVIIGNGISGITAARFIRKQSDHRITVISSETPYPYSRTALMYIYMGHLQKKDTELYERDFYRKNRIHTLFARVQSVNFTSKELSVQPMDQQKKEQKVGYDALIIATGSAPNKFGWPGQDLNGVRGLYDLQDLQYIHKESLNLSRAVIVGGGLIGVELAEMFNSREIPVTLLVREKSYWDHVLPPEESSMVNREIQRHGIDLQLEGELAEIKGNEEGHCIGIVRKNGEEIDCGFVGLTPGVHPNVNFLRGTELELGKGILVDHYLQTNIPDVYAIGDCAELKEPSPGRAPIEAVWYTAKKMGETVAHTITNSPVSYDPGIWFNSAKFFDIEYQVYGNVPAKEEAPLRSLYVEDDKSGRRSIRIVYDSSRDKVVGFHSMGIRLRHEMCDSWIAHQAGMEEVLQDFKAALFDPEFSSSLLRELYDQARDQIGMQLKSKVPAGAVGFIKGIQRQFSRLSKN